jgi:phosphatidylinositol alpha 1,6-mannosyltransferase
VRAPAEFAATIALLIEQPERLAAMRELARNYALGCSWDAVFDRVYAAYRKELR